MKFHRLVIHFGDFDFAEAAAATAAAATFFLLHTHEYVSNSLVSLFSILKYQYGKASAYIDKE